MKDRDIICKRLQKSNPHLYYMLFLEESTWSVLINSFQESKHNQIERGGVEIRENKITVSRNFQF